MLNNAAEKDNHYFVVLLSQQPGSCHVNVAPRGIILPPVPSPSVGRSGLFACHPCLGWPGGTSQKRVLEALKNSSQKRLTNRKGYAILQSLKRTTVEQLNQRNAS